jgi:hypothetical protein
MDDEGKREDQLMRLLKMACCAIALVAFTAPYAHADQWNKKTFLTFSQPVQVPGMTLPAGTYTFKLADLETNRHVVQIFDKDGGKLLATFLTVPDYKLNPPDNSVVMFEERPKTLPRAIKAWFYVGDTVGDEFVYPKAQAFKIAKAAHEPVLASSDDSAGAKKGTKVGRVGENGQMTAENETPASASRPAANTPNEGTTTTRATTAQDQTGNTGAQTPTANKSAAGNKMATTGTTGTSRTARNANANRNANGNGNAGAASARRTRTELPRTASSLTLLELLAAASLAGAFGVRRVRVALQS